MNFKAVKTSALLCLLFLVVYGGTNWLTAQRGDVASCYFAWERHILFVPLMILPYMSIDLFFIAAPFVCRDDRERRVLAKRIVAAILIAGAFFVLFPLRFAFTRPHVDGLLGVIFNNFRLLDQPFNQFPSLHIALQIILLTVFVRHTRGIARFFLRAWFALIAASTLLTWQHHVIDVIGGAALGAICVHLFDEQDLKFALVPNYRIACYYLLGAAVACAFAVKIQPWGLLLLWPAASLAIVSAAYVRCGAGIFRKENGKLSLAARTTLWPILLGQRISLLYYATRSQRWDRVNDHLWIGRKLTESEARVAVALGVTAVLDLCGEFSECQAFRRIVYRQLPILDLTAPTPVQLDDAVQFIREQISRGIVYVHCKAGYSRSAAAVGAYLLASGAACDADEVATILKTARPRIVIRDEVMTALCEYAGQAQIRRAASPPAFVAAPSTI